jgi:hypothetical protein
VRGRHAEQVDDHVLESERDRVLVLVDRLRAKDLLVEGLRPLPPLSLRRRGEATLRLGSAPYRRVGQHHSLCQVPGRSPANGTRAVGGWHASSARLGHAACSRA